MNRFLVLLVLAACGPATPARSPTQRAEASAAAVAALQASKFDDAIQQATAVLAADPGNARAAVVRATASYVTSIHALIERLGQIIAASERLEFFENPSARAAWQDFLTKLEPIDRDLAIAAADRDFSFELCLACWEFMGEDTSAMEHVLFLDDDHERHARFRLRMGALGHHRRYQLLYVFTAADAIAALRAYEGEITHAFLDHDLCEDDHLVAPSAPSRVPTGMAVVDHIVAMRQPPTKVTVHSFNYLAAIEMCARLSRLPSVAIQHIPFTELLDQLDPLV